MKIYINALSALLLTANLLPSTLYAETDTEKGLAIAIESDKRDNGFSDYSVNIEMVLRNKHNQETSRKLRTKTLEQTDDGDKTLIVFDNPKDVKGTAFLTHTHKLKSDDQWLFLPALKRVKRISSSNKSGPFMGSEFAYEDISSQEIEKYTYKYIKNETINGDDFFVIERYPTNKKSGYSKQVVWIDQKEYRTQKIDYYDRKKSLLKTLTYSGYKQYAEKFWRPGEMAMQNHQTGKSTRLIWSDYHFHIGLKNSDFTKKSLKRVK